MMSLLAPHMPAAIDDAERLAWLRLARTENVGPVTFFRLLERFGTAVKALEALPELSKRGGRRKPLVACPDAQAERELEELHNLGGILLAACEPEYPEMLRETEGAPPVISVLGDPALLQKPSIGIVGARNASIHGKKFAQQLAHDLGEAGHVVASGMARGIDTAAHQGSLSTGTIAVVAGGIDVIYPPENKALYQNIIDQGAVVAENALGQPINAQLFPRRNRIVSGLSRGVVVVEATRRSGSLITARLAGEQGRDIFAVPGTPLDPRAQGPNSLIKNGAYLVEDVNDILDVLNNEPANMLRDVAHNTYTAFPEPDDMAENDTIVDDQGRDIILQNLSTSAIGVDELARECQLSIQDVLIVLLEFELAGRIQRHPGNRVSLV